MDDHKDIDPLGEEIWDDKPIKKKKNWKEILGSSFCILVVIVFISVTIRECSREKGYDTDKHYVKEYFTVIDKTGPFNVQSGKGQSTATKMILVQRVKDTTKYAELSSADWHGFKVERFNNRDFNSERYFDSLFYNTKIGSKIYFKYIGKNRFFYIKNRHNGN